MCTQCTPYIQCELGELYVPCNIRNDSTCVQCSSLGSNQEFVNGGSCYTRCKSGYFLDSTTVDVCKVCEPLVSCDAINGVTPTSHCTKPEERFDRPDCIPCYNMTLASEERWSPLSYCQKICKFGAVQPFSNQTCVVCNPILCGKGFFGSCVNSNQGAVANTQLVCLSCGAVIGDNAAYLEPGNCKATCNSGFIENESGLCVAMRDILNDYNSSNFNNNSNSGDQTQSTTILYPIRTSKHSGMA